MQKWLKTNNKVLLSLLLQLQKPFVFERHLFPTEKTSLSYFLFTCEKKYEKQKPGLSFDAAFDAALIAMAAFLLLLLFQKNDRNLFLQKSLSWYKNIVFFCFSSKRKFADKFRIGCKSFFLFNPIFLQDSFLEIIRTLFGKVKK